MRVPNAFIDDFRNDKTAFRVAVAFYSLLNQNTEISNDGEWYRVSVKQTVLARIAGISVATLKRAINNLCKHGFISARFRSQCVPGRLGVTLYYIRRCPLNRSYFVLSRKALSVISSAKLFYAYALCCKLAVSSSVSKLNGIFFNSYSELADKLGVNRAEAIAIIKELVEEYKLLRKQRVTTSYGDCTDNKYMIVTFIAPRMVKRGLRKKALSIAVDKALRRIILMTRRFKKLTSTCSINLYERFVKSKKHKKRFFSIFQGRGSPKNELSIINPLKNLSVRE